MEFIENIQKEEYNKFMEEKKEKAHFLQSYEWGELSKDRGQIPYYVGLKDKNKLVATALLLKKPLPLGYSYFYIPRGFTLDYSDYDLIEKFTKEIINFTRKHKSLYVRMDPDIKLHNIDKDANPIDGENKYELVHILRKIGYKLKKKTYHFENMQPRFTFRIDLTPPIEEIEAKYSTTTKQRIKKGEKYGIEVYEGTTKKDLDIFCDLMKKTEIVKGFYSHDSKFYHKFYKVFKKDGHVNLYIGKINLKLVKEKLNSDLNEVSKEINSLDPTKNENKIKDLNIRLNRVKEEIEYYAKYKDEEVCASAYLIVHYGEKCWALYAGNHPDFKNLFANYVVYKYQIRKSKELGAKIFDVFGTIGDPNNQTKYLGLHEFKKKFGGEYTEFIGEFDYIQKPIICILFKFLVSFRHKIINKKLKKENSK